MPEEKYSVIMNPVIDTIFKRQSIRSYDAKPIPNEIIYTIIEAGNQAPSRGRSNEEGEGILFQPWRFVVVQDSQFRKKTDSDNTSNLEEVD